MSKNLEFKPVDEKDTCEIRALFSRPLNPIGEVCFKQTQTLITKHYTLSAKKVLELDVKPDDTWIISFPRSGTTWLEEMIWLLRNNLDYKTAQSKYLHKRFMFLELLAKNVFKSATEFDDIDSIIKSPSPRFIKTHLPLELLPKQIKTVKPKIFYIYRNPKDIVVSQYHFFNMIYRFLGSFDQFANIFLKEKLNYHPYWNHVLGFWELSKTDISNVKLISYEEMKQDLGQAIRAISATLNTSLTMDEESILIKHLDFDNMKRNKSINKEEQLTRNKIVNESKDVQFLRKGTVNQWKEMMNPEIVSSFDKWILENLSASDFVPFYLNTK